jgi:tetratricopeptide (TPR) repeat protein
MPQRKPALPERSLPAAAPGGERLRQGAALAILIAAGIACYANSFGSPFVFDGIVYVKENQSLNSLWPGNYSVSLNRPVGFLSFALNRAWGGDDVWGYHAVNLAIHVVAAWLLFDLVRRTLSRGRLAARYAAHAWGLALAIALIWLVHPLDTGSVTYIYQRLESLMGLFYLATLWCFATSLDAPRPGWWLAASVACCALGMGTKEVMVTAPLIVLWYDRVFAAASWREMLSRRGIYYAALAATWGLLAGLMILGARETLRAGVFFVENISPLQYALSQPGVILHYLGLAVWPDRLCLDYGWPPAQGAAQIVPQALAIGALLALTAWAAFRWPPAGFLGGCFFLILAPTSSLAPLRDLAFEHRMYLPLAAVVVLAVMLGYPVWRFAATRFSGRGDQPGPAARFAAVALPVALLLAIVAALGWRTVRRNADYRSNVAIWRATAQTSTNPTRAHGNLATALLDEGNAAEAIRESDLALEHQPDFWLVYLTRGNAYDKLGDYPAAVNDFNEVMRLRPDDFRAYINRGDAYHKQKNDPAAIQDFSQALELLSNTDDASINVAQLKGKCLANRGFVHAELHQYEAAADDYSQAIRLGYELPESYAKRGAAYARLGRLDAAIQDFNRAIELNPRGAAAHAARAAIYEQLGDYDRAARGYGDYLQLQPSVADAWLSRGDCQARLGRSRPAIDDYTQAIRLRPDSAKAHFNRGVTYVRLGTLRAARDDLDTAIRLDPGYVRALTARAELRATTADPALLDADQSVADATRACELTDWKNVNGLDVLGMACAAKGDFEHAIQWESRALELAPDDAPFQRAARQRLELYRAGKPYIETSQPP